MIRWEPVEAEVTSWGVVICLAVAFVSLVTMVVVYWRG